MARRSPRRVFDDLTWAAYVRGHMTGCPQARRYQRHVHLVRMGKKDPEELDEDLLPGRLVMQRSPEEREALRELTADMTQVRSEWVLG